MRTKTIVIAGVILFVLTCLALPALHSVALANDLYSFNREAAWHCYVNEISSFEYGGNLYSCTDFDFSR